MPGYTKEQLDAKGASLSRYTLCDICNLYWHKRSFKEHLGPAPQTRAPKTRQIEIIHPAWANFLDFLAATAVKSWMDERDVKIRRGEPIEENPTVHVESKAGGSVDEPEVLTVDEAVARLGLSREAILAEFEKHKVPFEVTIPAASRRARSTAKPAPKP